VLRTRKAGKRAKGRTPSRRSSRAASGRRRTGLELIVFWLLDRSPDDSRNSSGSRFGQRRSTLGSVCYWGSVSAIWVGLIFCGMLAYITFTMPPGAMAKIKERPPNVTLVARDGSVLAERGLRRGYIRLRHMPSHLVSAVLATEDRRFHSHIGVDPVGLLRAMAKNVQAGAIVEGGSTITQQLAKNVFLTPERTIARKLQEAVLAVWLETQLTKDQILELYLNRVYFGAGTYGVEAASRRYFGKSAREVTIAEAALLAGLLKAPSRYAPTKSPRLAEERAAVVLTNMVDAGLLRSARAMAAIAEPAVVRNPEGISGYEYAADWVMDLMPGFLGDWQTDIIVETTIDPALQRRAQEIVTGIMDEQGGARNAEQAAALVLGIDGSVRALVGGKSYKESQYNRVVRSHRQPGSAFKPFVYLAALESGMTPNTVIEDAPINVGRWRPTNYKNEYLGPVTMREALARSINTVAVRLTLEVGRWRVVRTARRLGIESDLHNNLSIALGTAEVSLMELVSAYAPFANGGYVAAPHIVMRIRTPKGKVVYKRRTIAHPQAIASPYVAAMNSMMQEVIVSGTGKRAALPGRPSAGKTGTTQNFRDAWFVGYTANYVAGVWVGNDDGGPMKNVTGSSIPADIWHEIMISAHRQDRPAPLPGTGGAAIARTAPVLDNAAREVRSFFDRVLGVFSPSG
jgi:penicillin-binding protein 1A